MPTDDELDRALPELRAFLDGVRAVANFSVEEEPQIRDLIELCQQIMRRRGNLPLAEYLRVLAR